MPHRHAICLVIDGLRASALGTYGNTTYPTPNLDALASYALVNDWLWADSPEMAEFYRSAWQEQHAARRAGHSTEPSQGEPLQWSVLHQLQRASVRQWLVTDEPWIIAQAGQLPVDETLLFENEAEHAAEQIEDTGIARFFSETIENLQQWREDTADSDSVAWLHCQGLYGPWDAPVVIRESLLDEEDPPAAEFIFPPAHLRDIDDPDTMLSYRVAYAAQVAVLDACVGAFLEAVRETFAGDELLFILTSSRGFALGEHGAIGTDITELHCEKLHLPWLLYPLGNTVPLPRQSTLCQPADLGTTVIDWFELPRNAVLCDGFSRVPLLRNLTATPLQLAVTVNGNEALAMHTPAWMLKCGAQAELFTKPDDRWEANDVADLCPDVVNKLREEVAAFELACREGQPLLTAPSDEELISPTR